MTTTKAKEKEPTLCVKIIGRTSDRDEVAITSDTGSTDPYVNRVVYAKPGVFTDGEHAAGAVAKLEEKSAKALDDEHQELLAKEAKELEARAKAEKKEEG